MSLGKSDHNRNFVGIHVENLNIFRQVKLTEFSRLTRPLAHLNSALGFRVQNLHPLHDSEGNIIGY